MANCVDHTESNFERLEREDKEKELRAELAPRLKQLEGRAVMYYDMDGKTHFGYLIKVGEVNCSVQPVAAINGALPLPRRTDILDVKPETIMTKLATLDEYLKAINYVEPPPQAPKQLDPKKPKKERKAKVKIQPDEAVKVKKAAEEKTPAKPKPTEAEIHAALGSAITKFGNACKNGHLYVIDTIYITTLMNKGKLGCKECDKIRKGKQ